MTHDTNTLRGVLAAMTVVCVWSGWVIVSKMGADSNLTIYDMVGLRFLVAGLASIPIITYFKAWRSLPLSKILILGALAGVPYSLFSFAGFSYAPGTHGGVFINGFMPVATVVLAFLFLKQVPTKWQVLAIAMVSVGAAITASDGSLGTGPDTWRGDLLFIAAAIVMSCYLVLAKRWQLSVAQVLLSTSFFSMVFYMPIWPFLPSSLASASWGQIVLQGGYQGLLPNIVGMLCMTYASRHLGPTITSALLAAVPAGSALLAWTILDEAVTVIAWGGIALLTAGILLISLKKSV